MNKDNYKKAIDQIHADERLKEKTLERINKHKNNKSMKLFLQCVAVLIVVFSVSILYFNNSENVHNVSKIENKNEVKDEVSEKKVATKIENNLPRFESMQQLKEVLEKNSSTTRFESIMMEKDEIKESEMEDSANIKNTEEVKAEDLNFSKTNTQVENVDEADIVKTDGEYIYYVSNNRVYIVNANELKIVSEIMINNEKERFFPREIFVNKDKLIILGNSSEYEENNDNTTSNNYVTRIYSSSLAKAIILDITDKKNPKEIRQVGLDGNYINSRMIGENIYLISNKNAYYYNGMKDEEILPILKDTTSKEVVKIINYTDIVYFEDTQTYNYLLVAGFNINNSDDVNVETFFGASDTVYASTNNLYISQMMYKYNSYKNKIFKFNLNGSQIILQCEAEIKGNLNNQFSMDEYEGKLRIATTVGYDDEAKNILYVLDENLKEIGKIDNLAEGERIYAVRFIGKVGYIVTFEQVDPLFVIDLSEPTNPKVKGELKIPGYSSYLHPYDETHIIGIGYNTKPNGYGGVTNANMKMSMFDVSDLEKPQEIFNIDIGNSHADSEITNNHKALFYNKNRDLIGFPVNYVENNYKNDKNGFVIFKISLESGFEKYGEILQEADYKTNINRVIYINDKLYALSNTTIIEYDLNTLEKINEITLSIDNDKFYETDVMETIIPE